MIIAQSAAVSIGFVLDAIFGDPDFKLHPIRLIGYLISFLEKVMRRIFTKHERLGGAVMAICVLIICGGVPFAILFFAWKLWGAGDSKLWLFVNFIYPAGWYAVSDKMLFPSMIMFMLIFIEAYIYLIGESLWLTVFHKERAVTFHQGKIQLEQLWDIGFSILFLSLVYTACSYVLGDYFESNRIFFSLIGILMTNKLVSARIPHKKIWTICMLTVYSLLSFTFWGGYDFRTLGMTVILVVVTHFSLKFTDRFNYEWIRTCDVKAGMILSYFAVQQFYGSRVKGLPTTTDETTKSRITQEEADSIKRWEKSKYGKEQIMVVRYIPFAVFILIGMITYLIGVWRLK